jgi:predicted amidohydrolase YtcJ
MADRHGGSVQPEYPATHSQFADLIVHNAKISTQDPSNTSASAIATLQGKIVAVGNDREVFRYQGSQTTTIDGRQRRLIPGLYDSHLHIIRGGLNYNMELRWDGVPSLADAMSMLKEQIAITPPPQWVRVVGGWTEQQFREKSLPTLAEINAVSPDTPVFILHLYDRALLNAAALRAIGYTKDTPDPIGSEIQRDRSGNPTGMLIARPNAGLLYTALGRGPKLSHDDQCNSTRHFMRELNRLGVTSACDAGGGSQRYPEDYAVINQLHGRGEMTVRIAYNLFTQKPKDELDDFRRWTTSAKYRAGDDFLRVNGGGEMLVYSAADFEDFLEPRPEMPESMESELEQVVSVLAANRWAFRMHATYDETIARALTVFEKVNRDFPLAGLRWFFDHAETVSDRNLERIKALGGGIAIQDRMAFQGEYFAQRYGKKVTERTPPINRMLEMGIPVGAGTDATRVSSHNPWVALYWLVTGKTVGGLSLYPASNRVDRATALRLYTTGSAWFSGEEQSKGVLAPGKLADFALLSDDYFLVPEDEIKNLVSVLTVVDGKAVYGAEEFSSYGPGPLPVSPDWSPVGRYPGYHQAKPSVSASDRAHVHSQFCNHQASQHRAADVFGLICDCFAF